MAQALGGSGRAGATVQGRGRSGPDAAGRGRGRRAIPAAGCYTHAQFQGQEFTHVLTVARMSMPSLLDLCLLNPAQALPARCCLDLGIIRFIHMLSLSVSVHAHSVSM